MADVRRTHRTVSGSPTAKTRVFRQSRDKIVELLRCAADSEYGIRTCGYEIGFDFFTIEFALDAWWNVPPRNDYRQSCLEAAARVEEGSWPRAR